MESATIYTAGGMRPHALLREAKAVLLVNQNHALELALEAKQLATEELDSELLAESLLFLGLAEHQQARLDEALANLLGARSLFEGLGHRLNLLETLIACGIVYRDLGAADEAIATLQQALELTRELQDPEAEARALNHLAGVYHAQSEYLYALKYLRESLEIYQRLGQVESQTACLTNIGTVYTKLGDFSNALQALLEGHSLVQGNTQAPRAEASRLVSIGNVYQDLGQYESAKGYFRQALEVGEKSKDRLVQVVASINLGQVQQKLADFENANTLLHEGLRIARDIGYKAGEIAALDGLGNLQISVGNLETARSSFQQALAIAQETSDREQAADALRHLGSIHLKLGQPPKALEYLHQALEIAGQIERKKSVFQIHELLAQTHEAMGDFRMALHHQREFHQAERALFNEESERKARNLSIQFELQHLRSETENYRLHSEHAQHARQEAEAKVLQRTRELEESQRDILTRLALASEYRDDDTGEHTWRVGRNAALLAEAMGLPEEEVQLIGFAARLHDVGKIGIPDAILLKPGRFSKLEYELMKSHAAIGAQMLSGGNSKMMRLAEEIAMTHHERWDGTGYPRGLAGEAIPLVGRIVAVADVFDALTHVRPYKPAWSIEEALLELQRNSGSQFDPRVVEAALKVFSDPSFNINQVPKDAVFYRPELI